MTKSQFANKAFLLTFLFIGSISIRKLAENSGVSQDAKLKLV